MSLLLQNTKVASVNQRKLMLETIKSFYRFDELAEMFLACSKFTCPPLSNNRFLAVLEIFGFPISFRLILSDTLIGLSSKIQRDPNDLGRDTKMFDNWSIRYTAKPHFVPCYNSSNSKTLCETRMPSINQPYYVTSTSPFFM